MKFVWITIALAIVFVVGGMAQEKRFEPEELSVFYYLSTSGQLVTLERVTPTPVSRTIVTLPGEQSSVRFPVGIDMQFIVRVTEDFAKAKATMQLVRFEAQHGMRRMKNSLRIDVEKYGSSSLKLVPHGTLIPGEYCLSRTTISQGFCFGVDPTRRP
jgi:hypothetical protein